MELEKISKSIFIVNKYHGVIIHIREIQIYYRAVHFLGDTKGELGKAGKRWRETSLGKGEGKQQRYRDRGEITNPKNI